MSLKVTLTSHEELDSLKADIYFTVISNDHILLLTWIDIVPHDATYIYYLLVSQ